MPSMKMLVKGYSIRENIESWIKLDILMTKKSNVADGHSKSIAEHPKSNGIEIKSMKYHLKTSWNE